MKRTAVAVILAVAALAMLASLVLQSRSLPLDVHLAQNTIGTELERTAEDFASLVGSLRADWAETRAPGDGSQAAAMRISSSPERLRPLLATVPRGNGDRDRLSAVLDTYSARTAEVDSLTAEITATLERYVDAVEYVRNEGTQIIQQMRDLRLDGPAADAFQLVVGTLDFATPKATVRELDLRRLAATLARDPSVDANLPREVERLSAAVTAVLDAKPQIEGRIEQLASTGLPQQATLLDATARTAYQRAVARGEQARLMLSIYSIALLLAVAFVAFRLQSSYRQINRANTELAHLNESLEQRVVERTRELAGTLNDLKESQVQLVQAEKISSLGQLVAGVSHEINTPLLYLTNNAVLIEERLQSMRRLTESCGKAFALNAEDYPTRADFQKAFVAALRDVKVTLAREDLEAGMLEAQDLARDSIGGLKDLTEMAQSLKDFSRLDRAPVASFDVNTGLDKTLLIARNIIKHKATVEKRYGDVPEIRCSPSQVNQVFLNLLTNAAQAIEGQGEIVVTTQRRGEDHVAISIADNGCGIPSEIMQRIRDPFFTTKEVGTGTGLGLSIVDEIIRSHDGVLEIESEVGKGSIFTVVLPVRQSLSAAEEELLADLDSLDGETPTTAETAEQPPLAAAG